MQSSTRLDVCVGGVHVSCSTCTVYVHHCQGNWLCNDGAIFYFVVTTSSAIYFLYHSAEVYMDYIRARPEGTIYCIYN